MKNKKIGVVTNKLEYERFTSKLVNCDLIIEHENPLTYFDFIGLNFLKSEFYFVGLRIPDCFLLKSLDNRCSKIVIFQHAFNENNEEKSVSYLLKNAKKFCAWVISILFSFLLRLKKKSKSFKYCYYFTEYYKLRLSKIIKNVNYKSCREPNPLIFGSKNSITIDNKIINYFYVDEPLSTTLGISIKKEKKLILKLINKFEIEKLYVKLHPRSPVDKFSDLSNIILTEKVFKNSKNLVGYKSNLLRFPFESNRFIKLSKKTLSWEITDYRVSKILGYIEDVKDKL